LDQQTKLQFTQSVDQLEPQLQQQFSDLSE
jgi:hypothetical protein